MTAKTTDSRWASISYFLLGQVGWFACVLTAARDMAYAGIATVLALIVAHCWRAQKPLPEIKLVLTVMLIGGVWENVLIGLGLLSYPQSAVIDGTAPLWLLALWGLFAAQLNTTYRWLKSRPLASALLGVAAGPLSFRAGASLGALHFTKPWPATAALAIGWAILLPTVVSLSKRWDGVGP